MADVGRALVITSIALVTGFSVLLLSVFDSQATYGILLSTTIVVALVADFLLSQPVGRVLSALRTGLPSGFMLFLFVAAFAGGILLLAVRPGG